MIKIDKRYFRPKEVESLIGESKKAKELLGWSPKISLEELINQMVDYDLELIKKRKIDVLKVSIFNYYG